LIDCEKNTHNNNTAYVNHSQIHSCNKPVLNNGG